MAELLVSGGPSNIPCVFRSSIRGDKNGDGHSSTFELQKGFLETNRWCHRWFIPKLVMKLNTLILYVFQISNYILKFIKCNTAITLMWLTFLFLSLHYNRHKLHPSLCLIRHGWIPFVLSLLIAFFHTLALHMCIWTHTHTHILAVHCKLFLGCVCFDRYEEPCWSLS